MVTRGGIKTALGSACSSSNPCALDIVVTSLRAGADPNALNGEHALLMYAAGLGRADVVRALLAAGADPNRRNAYGFTPLHAVCMRNDCPPDRLAAIAALLDAGANPNAFNAADRTPLMHAIASGDSGAAYMLFSRGGILPHPLDEWGMTVSATFAFRHAASGSVTLN